MPKETFISRFSLIINRLEKGPATYDQIVRYLEDESDIQDKNFTISKRTLQRDIKDIYSQFSIEIVNEKRGDKKYFIKSKPETQEHSQRLLESYQIINAIHSSQEFADILFLEKRKPKGLEHFYGLLYAIKNQRTVNFTHYKYWDETLTHRTVHPLGLKESQGRWYLIAVDIKDKRLKTFGLDRMEDIDISKSRFRETYPYQLKELYTHSFGIITNEAEKPEPVRLQFNYQQGQYVKTYPLHSSQKLINENENEVVIELNVYVTYDLVKELLSFGSELKVIRPGTLRNEIKKSLQDALKLYKRG
jgi:predicted DNA-binding transcriptional regulator YafY